jgi:hypothetical protein
MSSLRRRREILATGIAPPVADYTALLALTPADYPAGTVVTVTNDGIPGDHIVASSALASPDGGTTQSNATWFAASKHWFRSYTLAPMLSSWFQIQGDDTNEFSLILAFHDAALASGKNMHFGPGTFNTGDNSFPFKHDVTTSLKDYGGMIVTGSGFGKTIFKTTSVAGSDVLNLNAVKNITLKNASLTANLTGYAGAGSNGLSITNGGENIYIDLHAFSCEGIDQGSFMDGGKAFTVQNGAGVTNPFRNIKIRGRADDCPYAYNQDALYEDFDVTQDPTYVGIDVDIVAEDCWRGVTLGAAAAVGALAETDRDSDVRVKISCFDCAQPVVVSRWVRASVDCHIENRKAIAALYRPFAADQVVYAAYIDGDLNSDIKVRGRMLSADYKLQIGGASQGGGLSGACIGTKLDFEVAILAANVVTAELNIIDSGGNTINDSILNFSDDMPVIATNGTPITEDYPFLVASKLNRVFFGTKVTGSFTGTMTGMTTSPTGTVKYSIEGQTVSLEIPQILGTSNSTFMTMTGVPTDVRPITRQWIMATGHDNAVDVFAKAVIETDGTITFHNGASLTAGSWTAAGAKGVQPMTLTYHRS